MHIKDWPEGDRPREMLLEKGPEALSDAALLAILTDEIDAIVHDLDSRIKNGFKGSVGIITSFREQQARMEQVLNKSRDIVGTENSL